jgi:prolyl oligopeptidase PreP (S9A serine peptidase family)
MMAIAHVVKESDKASRDKYSAEMKALNARTALRSAREQFEKEEGAGGATQETRARLAKAQAEAKVTKADLERKVDLGWSAKNDKDMGSPNGPLGAAWNSLLSTFGYDTKGGMLGAGTGKTSSEYEAGEKAAQDFDALREEIASTKREMSLVNAALGGTLKVVVEGGMPGLPNATTGPGG